MSALVSECIAGRVRKLSFIAQLYGHVLSLDIEKGSNKDQ